MFQVASFHKTRLRFASSLFLRPLLDQKPMLFLLLGALLILGASQSLILFFLGPFLRVLLGPGLSQELISVAELLPGRMGSGLGISGNLVISTQDLIWLAPGSLFLAGHLRSLSLYAYQLSTARIALYIAKNYRDRFFAALLQQDYLYIHRKSPAEWMSALMNDVLFLQARFSDILNSFIRDGVIMISAFVSLLFIHPPLAGVLMVLAPFVSWGMGRTGKRIAYFAGAFQKQLASMAGYILEVRQRFDFIRAQGGEGYESKRWQQLNLAYYRTIRKSLLIRSAFAPVMEWLGFSLFAAVLYFFSGQASAEGAGGEKLVIMLAALGILLRPLRNIGEQIARLQETRGALKRSLGVFYDTALQQRPSLRSLPPPSEKKAAINSTAASLRISRLSVGYFPAVAAISISNLEISAGKGIAIVGPSGSGKSTLLRCLAGLIRPLIWEASREFEVWSRSCSMVAQEPFLFEDSLSRNLVYGHPDPSGPGSADIERCLGMAGVFEDVLKLPGGLQHRVQAIQKNLSGGQMQRLVIARALLRPAGFLLLDEASSAIDAEAERGLLKRLFGYCRAEQKGLIAVTHRLQCIDEFDEIWFLEQGRLIAKGPHAKLLAHARYREFYGSSQDADTAG